MYGVCSGDFVGEMHLSKIKCDKAVKTEVIKLFRLIDALDDSSPFDALHGRVGSVGFVGSSNRNYSTFFLKLTHPQPQTLPIVARLEP